MSNWLHGVQVAPLQIVEIRDLTDAIRSSMGVLPTSPFPVLEFLEFSLFDGLEGFDWCIADLPYGTEACAYPDGCTDNPDGPFIKLTQSVYDAAVDGDGRARMTILHECGHVLLHRKVAVHHRGPGLQIIKNYENSEWQADAFGAELLMPPPCFVGHESLEAFRRHMLVSSKAALVQGRKLVRRNDISPKAWLNNDERNDMKRIP